MPLPQGACHNATMLVALATGTAELATLPFAIEDLRRCHCHGEAATEGIINEFGSVGAAICFYTNVCGICHRQRATGNETFLKLENCHDATGTGNWPRMGRLYFYSYNHCYHCYYCYYDSYQYHYNYGCYNYYYYCCYCC